MLMHADAVAAWAQGVTAAIAAGAAWFARGQVLEARKTRQRVTQPDVVVFIDHNPKNWQWFDLVVKNFGQTPAYNVRVKLPTPLPIPSYLDPDTRETIAHLYIPDTIAVLAPGQEWRTLWNSLTNMDPSVPPWQFVGSVEFDELMNGGRRLPPNPIALDVNMFRNVLRFAEDDIPQKIADNIATVASTLGSYSNIHDGIWVYTVPSDDERKYRDQQSAHFRALHERTIRQLRGEDQ
jgi:hypothetical protein